MNRTKLENAATYLAVVIVGALTCLAIVATADGLFRWDLLPPLLDRIALLTIYSLLIVLAGCVLSSVVLNVSLIASNVAALAERSRHDDRAGR